jgi:hypothetical protein
MAVRIRSLLVSGPLVVPLSGGGSARLSPGEATDELPDVEVMNNPKVDKLRQRRLIDVEPVAEEAVEPEEEEESATGEEPESESVSETGPARAKRRRTGSGQR